jgi:hypothetical protein
MVDMLQCTIDVLRRNKKIDETFLNPCLGLMATSLDEAGEAELSPKLKIIQAGTCACPGL